MSLADILITPLDRIEVKGGDVLHAMKAGDSGSAGFGEAYFSWVTAGAVKAWKRHTRMAMNLVVPVGMIRFVFCSADRETFRIEEIGVHRYARITVPPGVCFGFKGLERPQSLLLNIASIPHDPNEVERFSLSEINFDWENT